ncbi:MAG: 5-(carboxyamino)imidazole ribonucleotide synthase [Propionibacteriales bacterium]|nr:5-(carboxyamino)imidazole ribonucleotide synthase [Propionibacteriales bacterium]
MPVVGVVGGGQLARMMQQAAIPLGVRLKLLAEGPDLSAAQVVPDAVVGDYRDLATLRELTRGCDVLTFDHEHVPTEHLRALQAGGVACRPGPDALVHAQDKWAMRHRLSESGVPCPRHAQVSSAKEVAAFAEDLGEWPVVLKSVRGGYDGKGVWFVSSYDDAESTLSGEAAPALARDRVLLAEERVSFSRELSVLLARSPSGQCAVYPVVESVQVDGICREVVVPAPDLPEALAGHAQTVAMWVAAELDVTGILAVEMFETTDGRILVNELAMRPHNTGHWSIDGADTSQFENHLRAVLDLPLGSPLARSRWTVMVNILGGEVGRLYDGFPHVFARDPRLRVHLYGKDVKPGRKVGHVTAYTDGDDLPDLLARARHAAAWFRGELDDEEQ